MKWEPEIRFLLACLRLSPDFEEAQRLAEQGLNWNYLIAVARQHKVLALLAQHTQEGRLSLPPKAEEQLVSFYKANAGRNLALTGELLQLLKLFEGAGIEALAIKGPTLAYIAYGRLAEREFADIDLIVRESQAEEAGRLLEGRGYRAEFDLTAKQRRFFRKLSNELAYRHSQKALACDLHWALLPQKYSFSPEEAWWQTYRQPVQIGRREVHTLSDEALLLYLCANAAKDNWSSLGALCDIAYMIYHRPLLKWDWIWTHQGSAGSRRSLRVGLYLAHTLLGADLPQRLLAEIEADRTSMALANRVQELLFALNRGLWSWFVTDNLYLGAMEGWQDKSRYWFETLLRPHPKDMEKYRLPDWLFWLYYPIRLYSFTKKYVKRGLSKLF
ncbi:MAG TPA: nucleotidyltransferase family protein [Chloroflexia bacterium]|nr:nucleotidyltransferase family protein [Chloroflexia bacterium]